MPGIVNHKIVETVSEQNGKIPIVNGQDERVFDFSVEDTGIFLYVKCHANPKKSGKNYKILKICLTDVLKQIFDKAQGSSVQYQREQVVTMLKETPSSVPG